ncbi:SPFH domain-containing protein [Amphritea sp. HPY]|uniref:SPFH domain-containing protein n=1 Tax=Amphritea sp. HPY TaxID=3421652 RepID=UPI003D7DE9BD
MFQNLTITKLVSAAVVTVLAVVIGFNSFTSVGVGKEKVGATFGKVHSEALTSGVHLVNPLADFERYDLQEMTYSWDNLGVPAQDNLKTSMDVAVTGHFLPGMTVQVRNDQGSAKGFMSNQVKRRVPAMIVEVGKELAKTSQDFYGETTLARMETSIIDRLNKELNQRGYHITAVKFSDINLPQVVTSAVIKTKQRTEEVNRQEADLKIADLKAQEKTAAAKAADASAAFNASAKKKAADAELYRVQKEAEGNKALARSVTPALIKLKQAEAQLKWDGRMPTTVMGESANVLMSMGK